MLIKYCRSSDVDIESGRKSPGFQLHLSAVNVYVDIILKKYCNHGINK